jgi:hypothetical protein
MSQNPIRDFLEACTSRLTSDDIDSPAGDDAADGPAGEASEGELARG